MTANSNLVHPTPIADLVPMRPALVHGVVVRFGAVFERSSRGRPQPVRTVLLRDATGEIPLTLWGEEVGHVRDADRLLLVEAWVGEYRGRPELALGSRGYIVNLGPANGRGPVWRPGPRGGLFVWGLVRRRLREKDLRARARSASDLSGGAPQNASPCPMPEPAPYEPADPSVP